MINPFLNIWIIFLLVTSLFFLYVLFYFRYIGGFYEIFWKVFYIGVSFIGLFIYFFIETDTLLLIFSNQIIDVLILKDLQDIVTLGLELSFIYSIIFISPLILFFIWMYFFNYFQKQKIIFWNGFLFLGFYYISLLKLILDNDLFLSSWEFFKAIKNYTYDFQPDFYYIMLTYIGDFYDLSFLFVILLLYFWLINNFLTFISLHQLLTKYVIIFRCIINIFFAFFTFYFFGGESIFRDFFILWSVFILFEVYFFVLLFLSNIKRKK